MNAIIVNGQEYVPTFCDDPAQACSCAKCQARTWCNASQNRWCGIFGKNTVAFYTKRGDKEAKP